MEENNSTTANNQAHLRQRIVDHYVEYILRNGQEPPSIFAFCEKMEIQETDFYQHFNQFDQVAGAFWIELHQAVIEDLSSGAEFSDFTAREKLLSYYYTFFSKLQQWRSFALITLQEMFSPVQNDLRQLNGFKSEFKSWLKNLVEEGKSRGEIASRASLTNSYPDLFWLQLLFLLNYWIKDQSRGFTSTDAAVEKSVHLSFDLIERNAFDSALDFAKFMFQKK